MIYINLERRIIMIKCDNLSEKSKERVSQRLYDYLAGSFREYCNFSYVTFYEPSKVLLNMVSYARNKILDFYPNATFPGSYILFEFEVTPTFNGLASLIVADDYLKIFGIDAKYASLIYRYHFSNTQTCIVNNFIYMTSGMPTRRDIWETVHDLATLRIMGKRDYVACNDKTRYQRAKSLEKELKKKGWNVDEIIRKLLNSKTNREELQPCFGYYFEYEFSNTLGHIFPKNQ